MARDRDEKNKKQKAGAIDHAASKKSSEVKNVIQKTYVKNAHASGAGTMGRNDTENMNFPNRNTGNEEKIY